MENIKTYEIGNKVIFNKIENYRIAIEGYNFNQLPSSQNLIKYEKQKEKLIGKIICILSDYYIIQYIPIDVAGRRRLDLLIPLSVKISDVKELSN